MNVKNKLAATAALLAITVSGSAYAVPTTWTDTVDFRPDRLITPLNGVQYQHTLEDFNVGVDTIDSYSLAFNLYNTGNDFVAAVISQTSVLNLVLPDSIFFNLTGSENGGWTVNGRYQLNSSGSLTVAVTSLMGDFYLGGSTLTAWGDHKPVPEPGTLALFGVALLGFGITRLKRAQV